MPEVAGSAKKVTSSVSCVAWPTSARALRYVIAPPQKNAAPHVATVNNAQGAAQGDALKKGRGFLHSWQKRHRAKRPSCSAPQCAQSQSL